MLISLAYSFYVLFSSEDIVGMKQMMPIIKDIQHTAMVWFSLSIMNLQQPLVMMQVTYFCVKCKNVHFILDMPKYGHFS